LPYQGSRIIPQLCSIFSYARSFVRVPFHPRGSKSDGVRERLPQPQDFASAGPSMRDWIGYLSGSVRNDGLPADLSRNKKKYLPELIRAAKRHRR